MFKNLKLGKILKVATGIWILNMVIGWIIDLFKK